MDLRHALRTMRKAPGFAAAAMATVALGIGVSTAMFSVTDAVLLRPLPYKNQGRLVLTDTLLSNADYWDLKSVFEDMSATMVYRAIVPREDGSAERVSKGQVTTNFFGMMGAKIAFGRDFTEADGRPPARLEPLGSGLMFRSFLELRSVHPGYDPHGLLTFLAVGDAGGSFHGSAGILRDAAHACYRRAHLQRE